MIKMYPIKFELYDEDMDVVGRFTSTDGEIFETTIESKFLTKEEVMQIADLLEKATKMLEEGVIHVQ